jgi:general stress protein YciG
MIMAQNNQQNGNNGNRGFAGMDPQKQREIASEGGRAAHASGNAHEFNSEEAPLCPTAGLAPAVSFFTQQIP